VVVGVLGRFVKGVHTKGKQKFKMDHALKFIFASLPCCLYSFPKTMNHIFHHKPTNAWFSISNLDTLHKETDSPAPHKWYSIIIINKTGMDIIVDGEKIKTSQPQAIFITPGQYMMILAGDYSDTYVVSFNSDFYCIELHDSEVACNGLLFRNNFNVVVIALDTQQQTVFNNTVAEMIAEFNQDDLLKAEMLKNLLKNLLIRSNRLFRSQQVLDSQDDSYIDFARKFSKLVEMNYLKEKQVEFYAEKMGIAPATLTKKLQKYGSESPSRIIKNRILTQAKRHLIYSDKSVKEIAFLLGYDDPHYFSRLFLKETNAAPSDYRKSFQVAF
jgi:AraC-like DNA-binding protein